MNSQLYKKHLPLLTILFLFFVIYSSFQSFRFSSVVTISVLLLMFVVTEKEKINALKYLTKSLAFIVFITLIASLINQFIYSLPFENMQYGSGKGDDGSTILRNYYFFIEEGEGFSRFYSVFDEPGVLGTLSSLILFANKYNFKNKYNIILLIGGLFTFSLAFIAITIIGMVFHNIKKGTTIFKTIILILILSVLVFFTFRNNETFQRVLLYRITNINSSGIESRTADILNNYYKDYLISTDVIIGKGTSFFNENKRLLSGQNYKMFVIEYGLLGTFLIMLMYISMIKKGFWFGYICFLLFIISFLQRPDLFTPWQIILFSISISNLNFKLINKGLS